jgi:hypothetical protein
MTRGDERDVRERNFRRTFVLLLSGFVLSSFLSTGCVRDVTEDDCTSLAKHLHEVWTSDAKFPEKPGPSAERAVAVIKSEGDKLEQTFFNACKRDYVGKPKASGEFSCLSRAKTYAEVQTCATIPVH